MTEYILFLIVAGTAITISQGVYVLFDYCFDNDCDLFATWDD
jgi:hypothetical protein